MVPTGIEEVIVASVVTGLVTSVGTIAALKVDLKWAHHKADTANSRIDRLEERLKDFFLNNRK